MVDLGGVGFFSEFTVGLGWLRYRKGLGLVLG